METMNHLIVDGQQGKNKHKIPEEVNVINKKEGVLLFVNSNQQLF